MAAPRPSRWRDGRVYCYSDPSVSRESRGPSGRPLCRGCAAEVPRGRRAWCGHACVHAHLIRSRPGYLRRYVFYRDKGVCRDCGCDTAAWKRRLKALPPGPRRELGAFLEAMGFRRPLFRSLWEAEHLVAVAEGGGQCGLAGLGTLCQPCHRRSTAALNRRLAAARRASREASEEA